MYLCYLAICCLCRIIKFDFSIPALVVFSVLGIGIVAFSKGNSWLWDFLCWENFTKYFQFFALGIVASKYRDRFFTLLDNNYFVSVVIIGWILCFVLWYDEPFRLSFPLAYNVVHDIVIRYCALLTVIVMFHAKAQHFSDSSVTGKTLQFIGQRTLDIYMIHYFLLPNLRFMQSWLENGNMLVIQFLIASVVTTCIVALCLLVSLILRRSPYLESWLFGVKAATRN